MTTDAARLGHLADVAQRLVVEVLWLAETTRLLRPDVPPSLVDDVEVPLDDLRTWLDAHHALTPEEGTATTDPPGAADRDDVLARLDGLRAALAVLGEDTTAAWSTSTGTAATRARARLGAAAELLEGAVFLLEHADEEEPP